MASVCSMMVRWSLLGAGAAVVLLGGFVLMQRSGTAESEMGVVQNVLRGNVTRALSESNPAACANHPGCSGLSGNCCPHDGDGVFLGCCGHQAPAAPIPIQGMRPLHLTPFCDHLNVGRPNCGNVAKCEGEYFETGSGATLKATSGSCSFVTFKSGLNLNEAIQLDADVFIAPGTCSDQDNLAFWFFQTIDFGTVFQQPASHWDAFSEVDLMETYIGNGGINSVNTNFAGTGIQKQWEAFTIEGGMAQHVTMWVDESNAAGCPSHREEGSLGGAKGINYGKALPVVSVYVRHCPSGAPCCQGDACRSFQAAPDTASSCVTVKDAPMLFSLSNWGSGHRVKAGCELGFSNVQVRTK